MNDAMDRFVEDARRPVHADDAAVQRLEDALRAMPAPEGGPMQRRHLYMPLAPLAVAAAIIIAFAAGLQAGRHAGASTDRAGDRAKDVAINNSTDVTFLLVEPRAREVSIVGAFNDWTPERTRMVKGSGSVWTVVLPLQPGSYNYAFVVDGRVWVPDPAAPRASDEDFGRPTSVVLVEQKDEAI